LIHLFLGLPLILPPTGFLSNILLGILIPSILITCPSQAIGLQGITVHFTVPPEYQFTRQLDSVSKRKQRVASRTHKAYISFVDL
jgi:hypothetical protein